MQKQRKHKVKLEDFELDKTPPSSIRQLVEEQVYENEVNATIQGKRVKPLDEDGIDQLMQQVYAKIEKEALATYQSNEPWALKRWALTHILEDEFLSEVNENIAQGLVEPVVQWQKETFDPLLNLRRKLQFSGRKESYTRECLRVANWFVSLKGRKGRYTEQEILEFLDWLDKRYDRRDYGGRVVTHGRETSPYVTKVHQFKRFLEALPEDDLTGRKQTIPFQLPSFPDKFHQPAFITEEIAGIIFEAVWQEKPAVVLRIALATIYGCRCGEIANMSSEHINIDGDQSTVDIPTEKKGKRVPQPIPDFLVPLFSVPLSPCSRNEALQQLRRVYRRAHGYSYPAGSGYHAIRRAVVSNLYLTDLKEITISRFMRWSETVGHGVMPKYVRIPIETTDLEVIAKHPFVETWRALIPFCQFNPKFAQLGMRFNETLSKSL